MTSDTSSPGAGEPAVQSAALVPVVPKKLGEEAQQAVRDQASELAAQMQAAPDDRQLARRLGSLGSEAQQKAGAEMSMKTVKKTMPKQTAAQTSTP